MRRARAPRLCASRRDRPGGEAPKEQYRAESEDRDAHEGQRLVRRRVGRGSRRVGGSLEPRGDPRRHFAVRTDREVVGQLARRGIDADLREPGHLRDPVHALVGAKVVQKRRRRGLAVLELHTVGERRREQQRLAIGKEIHVRVDPRSSVLAGGEDAKRDPGVRGRDRDMDRRAVTDLLALGLCRVRVEDRRHEDRAARRVEVEDLGGIRWETEAVLGGPASDRLAAAAEDRDVERVDLHLHQDHRVRCRRRERDGAADRELRDLRLADEALERPVAALFHGGGNTWQGNERAELPASALELERRDVVLDAVVVAGEGRRPEQVDRAVGADQARAGRRRLRTHDEGCHDCCRAGDEPSHTVVLLPAMAGWRYDDGAGGRFRHPDRVVPATCCRLVPSGRSVKLKLAKSCSTLAIVAPGGAVAIWQNSYASSYIRPFPSATTYMTLYFPDGWILSAGRPPMVTSVSVPGEPGVLPASNHCRGVIDPASV